MILKMKYYISEELGQQFINIDNLDNIGYEILQSFSLIQESIYTFSNQNIKIYLLFGDKILDKNLLEDKILLYITVPVCFIITIFISFIIFYLYEQKLCIINELETMVSYVNHEIRTPLSIVNGYIDISLLRLGNIVKKEEDLIFIKKEVENIISNLNTSKSCSKILLVIVNDILDLQKLEKGKLNLIEKTFKIKDLIDILERSILHKIEEASLSVKFKIESNCKNIKIYSDINRLVQIGINFLINAFKYTTKGEITLFINIINNYFVLKVKDTGIGIKEDLKNQIFINKFIGVNNNSLPGLRGIGIGLYLCKRLSILLGGNVKFESKVNKGSTFSLEIPISKLKIKNLEELNNEDGDERNGDERNIEIITI